jgi:hypothetical protein
LLQGDLTPFAHVLEAFFQKRSFHTAKHTNEATFQVVIKMSLSWSDRHHCISELNLHIDPSTHPKRLDLLIVSNLASAAIELKHVTLYGLWKASGSHWEPSWDDLEELRKVLNTETEEQLLQRSWSYYDKDARSWQMKSVQTIKDEAVYQLQKYFGAITRGMAEDGVFEKHVQCIEGQSHLYGYVTMSVGNSRVLSWLIENEQVDCILQDS